jgi:hypothetical protein
MRKILLHCGLKLAVEKIYRVLNFQAYSQMFLLMAFCPHCLKSVLGCAGYDVWDRPVYYLPSGDIWGEAKNSLEAPLPLRRIMQPSKRESARYLQLIADGQAQPVQRVATTETSARSTRGGMVGLSEYSRRAAAFAGRDYILRLGRINRRLKKNIIKT